MSRSGMMSSLSNSSIKLSMKTGANFQLHIERSGANLAPYSQADTNNKCKYVNV